MKALKIWIVMMLFNGASAFILLSGIFPPAYNGTWNSESVYINTANSDLNITIPGSLTDTAQFGAAAGVLEVIRRGVTFDWVFEYTEPLNAQTNMVFMRVFLGAMALIINSAMIIELWLKFRDPLD